MYLTHFHKKGVLREEGGDANRSPDLRYRRESGEKKSYSARDTAFSHPMLLLMLLL